VSLDPYPGDAEILRRVAAQKQGPSSNIDVVSKRGKQPIDCGPAQGPKRKLKFPVSIEFTSARHPDGHFTRIKGTIHGGPRTKKNSNTHHGIASKAYRFYRLAILGELKDVGFIPCMPSSPLNLEAQFYVDSAGLPSDLSGLLQALSDILQDAGFITDDKWLRGFDRSRKHEFDTQSPRVEFTLELLPIL
jgi:hypothetical protein